MDNQRCKLLASHAFGVTRNRGGSDWGLASIVGRRGTGCSSDRDHGASRTGRRASTALHQLRRGAVVGLGTPAGDFVLDGPIAPELLLVGGGSGITPSMAMIRDLADRRQGETSTSHARDGGNVIVIHGSRNAADAIFGAELASLAARFDWLRIHARRDDDVESGRLDARDLRTLVPDLARRRRRATQETYRCGRRQAGQLSLGWTNPV